MVEDTVAPVVGLVGKEIVGREFCLVGRHNCRESQSVDIKGQDAILLGGRPVPSVWSPVLSLSESFGPRLVRQCGNRCR